MVVAERNKLNTRQSDPRSSGADGRGLASFVLLIPMSRKYLHPRFRLIRTGVSSFVPVQVLFLFHGPSNSWIGPVRMLPPSGRASVISAHRGELQMGPSERTSVPYGHEFRVKEYFG